jgi:hypothetical protein
MISQPRPSARLLILTCGMLLAAVIGVVAVRISGRAPSTSAGSGSAPPPVSSDPGPAPAPSAPDLLARIDSAGVDDFPEMMRSLLKAGAGEEPSRLLSRLLQRWLVEDLASFEEFLDEAERDGVALWDPLAPGLVDALRSLEDRVAGSAPLAPVIERVLLGAAGNDPVNARAWAREFLSGDRLDSAYAGIAPLLAAVDPGAAIELLDEVTVFPRQMEAASGVGLVLGRSGYPLAMTWAESFYSETERSFALSGVLSGMAVRETTRAAEEYRRIVGMMKDRHREQVLADRALSGGTIDEEYEGLSPEEIEKAELAKPNPNLAYFETAARTIALGLSREDPRAALEWARSMDLYQGRAVALETIYEAWGSSEPGPAFESFLSEPGRRPESAGGLFTAWAAKNARAASEAALTLAPGPERDSAIEGVARGWIRSGTPPARIASWAERLPAGSGVDRVRALVASEAAFDNPVLALRQVERIANPLKRSELFQEVFPNLVEENPDLARQALATIRLSPVEIEYFQEMLGP